jgi:hypothetical protein
MAWNIVFGIMGGLAAIRFLFVVLAADIPIGSAIFLAIGIYGLARNYMLGPGARVYVMTGVQTAVLPALVRLKKARRVLQELEPLIAAAQAHLVPPVTGTEALTEPAAATESAPAAPDTTPNG